MSFCKTHLILCTMDSNFSGYTTENLDGRFGTKNAANIKINNWTYFLLKNDPAQK